MHTSNNSHGFDITIGENKEKGWVGMGTPVVHGPRVPSGGIQLYRPRLEVRGRAFFCPPSQPEKKKNPVGSIGRWADVIKSETSQNWTDMQQLPAYYFVNEDKNFVFP